MADVKKACVDSLGVAALGKTPKEAQNGKDFYKFFFTKHPELRKHFKGAENFSADDVQKSDRFEKLGTGLLMSVHILANTYDNEMAFWGIWVAFLESKGASLSGDQKGAWDKLGTRFNEEAQAQLAKHGLPHT
ncbi:GLOBIN domain-containing protein [Trichostrongylus colubriformis]|uniref:GLOBIN domain-containing protein n=1 Tax=Trichostrongylus colubriformis TaxID=6319 RepID=A0AAN8G258_TRICO